MITKEIKLDHFSMLYRNFFKPNVNYKDVLYADDVLYVAYFHSSNESRLISFNKDTLEEEEWSPIIYGTHILKLFDGDDKLIYLARKVSNGVVDNYGPVILKSEYKENIDNVTYSTAINEEIGYDDTALYHNLLWSDDDSNIALVFNNKLYVISKSTGEMSITSNITGDPNDEIVCISLINGNIYYGYRRRMLEFDPNNSKRRLNLNKYVIGKTDLNGNSEQTLMRLVSYNDIDDVRPISINHDGTNLIVTTSDGYLRLYRPITNEGIPEDYAYSYRLYDQFIPGFAKESCNPACTCTKRVENLLYVGNDIGDIMVYIANDKGEYQDGMYMDNVGNAAITDIITYDYNLIVNFDGNGLSVYKRDIHPYIDDDVIFNSYIRDEKLNAYIRFKLGHTDPHRKLKYNITSNVAMEGLPEDWSPWLDPGYEYEDTLSIPCKDVTQYDIWIELTIEDDLGSTIGPLRYDVQTLFVDEPVIFDNQISICYQTAPSPNDDSVNVDLMMDYEIIQSHIIYKKTSVLDPGSKIYVPSNHDEETRFLIESCGVSEGDYYCEVEEWEFSSPIAKGTVPAISTNGLDWNVRVDNQGRLITEPCMGVSFNYINLPVEDTYPDRFIYAYRFYHEDGSYTARYPDDVEYYIYDKHETLDANYRSRETGDINNNYDFHLLDLIINCTRVVPMGSSLFLKVRKYDKGSYKVYKVAIDEDGRVITNLIPDISALGKSIDDIPESVRLTFRDNAYSSSVTLKVVTDKGNRYWDFSIMDDGHINTTELEGYVDRIGDLVFLGREKFDYNYVADVLRRLSNPVSFVISSDDHKQYEVIDSIDKAGTKTSTTTKQMQVTVHPTISGHTPDIYTLIADNKYRLLSDLNGNSLGIIPDNDEDVLEFYDYYYTLAGDVNKVVLADSNGDYLSLGVIEHEIENFEQSDELFTANYHYFDVFIDGKKLPKEQVIPVKSGHGDFSVRFPYVYDFSKQDYILECVDYNPDARHYIDQNNVYHDDRFRPLGIYYQATIQTDDRLKLTQVR